MKNQSILVIGGQGHLGSLLAKRIHSLNIFSPIYITYRTKKENFNELSKIAQCFPKDHILAKYLPARSDMILVCVKPQDAVVALKELAPKISDRSKLVVSTAAALKFERIRQQVGKMHCIARVMPNIFAKTSNSITFISYEICCDDCKKNVEGTFLGMGKIMHIPETLMNPATVLGASMPAIIAHLLQINRGYYNFSFPEYLKEILLKIACKKGFTLEEATTIIDQNLLGLKNRCSMSYGNDQKLDDIIKEVATDQGCTRVIIDIMKERCLEKIISGEHRKEEIALIIEEAIDAGIARLDALSLLLNDDKVKQPEITESSRKGYVYDGVVGWIGQHDLLDEVP